MSNSEEAAGSRLQGLKEGRPWERLYAYAYFTVLLLIIIGSLSISIWMGWIEPNVVINFQPDLGWVGEYFAGLLLVLFGVWSFIQLVRVAGIGFFRGLIGTIARIADNYELPQEAEGPPLDQEEQDQEERES